MVSRQKAALEETLPCTNSTASPSGRRPVDSTFWVSRAVGTAGSQGPSDISVRLSEWSNLRGLSEGGRSRPLVSRETKTVIRVITAAPAR